MSKDLRFWFTSTKPDPDKVCGYLDYNGRFFIDKKERDKSNFKISESFVNKRLDEQLIRFIDTATLRDNIHGSKETRDAIHTLKRYGFLEGILRVYAEHQNEIKLLKQKYES